MSGQKPREIALQILQHRRQGEFVEKLLERALAAGGLRTVDRHLCQELVYGVVRWQLTLDWLIARKARLGKSVARPPPNRAAPTANFPGTKQEPRLQDLLRLGLYQIFWLERIPNHAAVNETVELARRNGGKTGFVNAMLRGYLREFEATGKLLDELKAGQPALGYSHPEWLVTRWQQRWGPARAIALMVWNNTPPKTFARVNTLKIEAGKLLTQWREEDVQYDFFLRDWLEENLIFELKSHPPLAGLPSFQQGLFYVQDPSTLLAARELAPQPGELILDLCAAPGGKLTYLAQLMRDKGRLVAHDTTPQRLKLVTENCQRLGVTCAEPVLPSTLTPAPGQSKAMAGQPAPLFDRVLVDAPCSNTGVLRRRVDLRWRIRPAEIRRLRGGQLELLRQASAFLKPKGTLVYSTCSLEPEENEGLVNEFLESQPGFKLEHARELSPFQDEVDGAYVARLIRVG